MLRPKKNYSSFHVGGVCQIQSCTSGVQRFNVTLAPLYSLLKSATLGEISEGTLCCVNHVYKICRRCVSNSVLHQWCSEIQCMCVYICIWKQIRNQSNCDKMMVNFLLKSLISNLLVVCESAPWSSLLATHPEFGFIGKMQLKENSEYNGKFDFIFLS